jgi:hypothetical protein
MQFVPAEKLRRQQSKEVQNKGKEDGCTRRTRGEQKKEKKGGSADKETMRKKKNDNAPQSQPRLMKVSPSGGKYGGSRRAR